MFFGQVDRHADQSLGATLLVAQQPTVAAHPMHAAVCLQAVFDRGAVALALDQLLQVGAGAILGQDVRAEFLQVVRSGARPGDELGELLRRLERTARDVHVPRSAAHRRGDERQPRIHLQQATLGLALLRDVLDMAEKAGDAALVVTHGRHFELGVDERSVAAQEALFHVVTNALAQQRFAQLPQVNVAS